VTFHVLTQQESGRTEDTLKVHRTSTHRPGGMIGRVGLGPFLPLRIVRKLSLYKSIAWFKSPRPQQALHTHERLLQICQVQVSTILCLMNVPFRYSSNAVLSSSCVFITMGPYHALAHGWVFRTLAGTLRPHQRSQTSIDHHHRT
jgi:hypothetical protein